MIMVTPASSLCRIQSNCHSSLQLLVNDGTTAEMLQGNECSKCMCVCGATCHCVKIHDLANMSQPRSKSLSKGDHLSMWKNRSKQQNLSYTNIYLRYIYMRYIYPLLLIHVSLQCFFLPRHFLLTATAMGDLCCHLFTCQVVRRIITDLRAEHRNHWKTSG